MNSIRLDGTWKLYYLRQATLNIGGPSELKASELQPIDAVVPGNVELDLERAGVLEDPFFGDNIHELRPYEFYEWWYEREFEAPSLKPGQRVELVFHGVDCLATYWLNGKAIGESDNMLIEHGFDITDDLKPDSMNVVTVR